MKQEIKNPACAELKNFCDKDGFCEAECLEDTQKCKHFSRAQTLFPGSCVFLMFKGNCQNPDALQAKWKALKAAAKPAER